MTEHSKGEPLNCGKSVMEKKKIFAIVLTMTAVVAAAVLFILAPWDKKTQPAQQKNETTSDVSLIAESNLVEDIEYGMEGGDEPLSDEEMALLEDSIVGEKIVNIVDPLNELTNVLGVPKVIYLKEILYYMVRDEAALRDQKSFTVKPGSVEINGTVVSFSIVSDTNPNAQVDWIYETIPDKFRYRIVGITEEEAGAVVLGKVESLEIHYPDGNGSITIVPFERRMTIINENGRAEEKENLPEEYINDILFSLSSLNWEEYQEGSLIAVYDENGKLSPINSNSFDVIYEQVSKGL